MSGGCECRKPGPLLYRRAAADLGLDLDQAGGWVIACATSPPRNGSAAAAVLVLTGAGTADAGTSAAQGWLAVPDLATAVHLILSSTV